MQPTTSEKQSKARKRLWQDPVFRKKQHESRCAAQGAPDARIAQAKRVQEQWASGKRSKQAASTKMKARWASDSGKLNKQAMTKRMKKLWEDPNYRDKLLPKLTARWALQASKNSQNETWLKNNRERLAKSNTPERSLKISLRVKALWADPEYRAKMIAVRKSSYTKERTARLIATREKNNPDFIPWNKGKTKDTDSRLAKTSKDLTGIVPNYKKQRVWYHGTSGPVFMRSMWEVAYAHYLDDKGITWKYEYRFFNLGGPGCWHSNSYTPDFYLPATKEYVEIKGRLELPERLKLLCFRVVYPNIRWSILMYSNLYAMGVIDQKGNAILSSEARSFLKVKPEDIKAVA